MRYCLLAAHTCQTGSVCLPVFAVERNFGAVPLSCRLYTATVPEEEREGWIWRDGERE